MGWGQVGQHRASGHKGGLGVTGMMKHHWSTTLKKNQIIMAMIQLNHLTQILPRNGLTSVILMTCLLSSVKKKEKESRRLESAGYEKLLGGGKVSNAYSVKVTVYCICRRETKAVGGEVISTAKEKSDGEEVVTEDG